MPTPTPQQPPARKAGGKPAEPRQTTGRSAARDAKPQGRSSRGQKKTH